MPIIKSESKSRIVGGTSPSTTAAIEFEELCCMCGKEVYDGQPVLRHSESNHIICIKCLIDIASMKI